MRYQKWFTKFKFNFLHRSNLKRKADRAVKDNTSFACATVQFKDSIAFKTLIFHDFYAWLQFSLVLLLYTDNRASHESAAPL